MELWGIEFFRITQSMVCKVFQNSSECPLWTLNLLGGLCIVLEIFLAGCDLLEIELYFIFLGLGSNEDFVYTF